MRNSIRDGDRKMRMRRREWLPVRTPPDKIRHASSMTNADMTLAVFTFFQQPSLFGLRPADRQGGQGPEWSGGHFVWDVGAVPRLACVCYGLCDRESAGLDNGFPVSEQCPRLRHHPDDSCLETLPTSQTQHSSGTHTNRQVVLEIPAAPHVALKVCCRTLKI
jgi:hypothetical protein